LTGNRVIDVALEWTTPSSAHLAVSVNFLVPVMGGQLTILKCSEKSYKSKI